jgi:hemoglobin
MRKILIALTLFVFVCTCYGEEATTLYKRLGGYDAIAAVTDAFIGKMAADPQLKPFFAGHSQDSLTKIRQLVVDQLCMATGGPCKYIGRDMKTVHQGLGISQSDWDRAVKTSGGDVR